MSSLIRSGFFFLFVVVVVFFILGHMSRMITGAPGFE